MKSSRNSNSVLAGLRGLCAAQPDGHTYSTEEIAAVCGCTRQNISAIERSAFNKASRRLRGIADEMGVRTDRRRD